MGTEQSWTALEGALEHQGTCVSHATKNPVQSAPTQNAAWWGRGAALRKAADPASGDWRGTHSAPHTGGLTWGSSRYYR